MGMLKVHVLVVAMAAALVPVHASGTRMTVDQRLEKNLREKEADEEKVEAMMTEWKKIYDDTPFPHRERVMFSRDQKTFRTRNHKELKRNAVEAIHYSDVIRENLPDDYDASESCLEYLNFFMKLKFQRAAAARSRLRRRRREEMQKAKQAEAN